MKSKLPKHPMNFHTKLYLQFLLGYGLFVLVAWWVTR